MNKNLRFGHIDNAVGEGFGGLEVGFAHRGQIICNPFYDESYRWPVQPEHYGFWKWHTGGGCWAWVRVDEDNRYVMLTDLDGSDLPADDGEGGWMLGLYTNDDHREPISIIIVDADGSVEVEEA